MKTKRIIIIISEFILHEIVSFIIEKVVTINTSNMALKHIIENMIIYGTCSAITIGLILLIYWYFKDLNYQVKYMKTKLKYYDIMLINFMDKHPSDPIFNDTNNLLLYKKDEPKYLTDFDNEFNKMKVIMKGTNTNIGRFQQK